EQDMRKMGALWRRIPITYVTMWVGSLALAGIFPFSGYFSKDAILEAAFAAGGWGYYGFLCGLLAAFLTAFYSWRLILMTFHGPSKMDHHVEEHVHESPPVMTVPLIVLSLGALLVGFLLRSAFIGEGWPAFWRQSIAITAGNHVLRDMESLPGWVGLAPTVVGVLGIATAYLFYVYAPTLPARMAETFRPIYLLFYNKWYFDEIYDFLFVRPTFALARTLWQVGDATIIDGVPNGLATLTADGSREVVKIQTGSIAVYAFVMLIGLVVLVALYLLIR
ncbi:MAG: NADH-quinone oxidoreductase subunit L, partial [Alphaproteobacteria bacterium]|nr:NADH-quinone oxidoreductase subunit L [Alphaproteobacteria bacterium]